MKDKESLASRDSWFRPVDFYIGPDGALYVIDFYRQIIDRSEFLSDSVMASGNLFAVQRFPLNFKQCQEV